ncbi:uncharacterized protein LOC127248725 isoform X2 [Andrographis paniculata]|uniref:uncharacterized protein LOC127248725 isoform X2 n=1 Tax=Andrographis paniculata TaxID=175694 RepID=UPI0021E9054C|nr:uncharacterized protein LOC127248725 isoform X2 [Andrographis paniculata]
MLNYALRSGRALPLQQHGYNNLTNKIKPSCGVRFASSSQSQDNNKDPKSKTSDTMSSFGEGYTTRSEEEGFGGIHGGNQSPNNSEKNSSTAEFDESQGSDVKEKETSRHQTKTTQS